MQASYGHGATNTKGVSENGLDTFLGWEEPWRLSGLKNVNAISSSGYVTSALDEDGQVWQWGVYQYLGARSEPYNKPGKVTGLTNVKAIAQGNSNLFALKKYGAILACGTNGHGRLGFPKENYFIRQPRPLAGLKKVVAVGNGDHLRFAVTEDGAIWLLGIHCYRQRGTQYARYITKPEKQAWLTLSGLV